MPPTLHTIARDALTLTRHTLGLFLMRVGVRVIGPTIGDCVVGVDAETDNTELQDQDSADDFVGGYQPQPAASLSTEAARMRAEGIAPARAREPERMPFKNLRGSIGERVSQARVKGLV